MITAIEEHKNLRNLQTSPTQPGVLLWDGNEQKIFDPGASSALSLHKTFKIQDDAVLTSFCSVFKHATSDYRAPSVLVRRPAGHCT